MGDELGLIFHFLMQEAAWLHLKWNEFDALFGGTPQELQNLNRAAQGFFGMVQDVWSDDIILHICRMTDNGTDRLSVTLLPKLANVGIRDELKRRLDEVTAATAFARDWRDRRIAHRNKALILDPVGCASVASRQGRFPRGDQEP